MVRIINMAKKESIFKTGYASSIIIAKQDCYGYEITKQIKTYSHELIDIKRRHYVSLFSINYRMHYISSYEKVIERKIKSY